MLNLESDVLIIGGGMAAGWAAIGAARAGAEVILVDKGYVGTSGVTATGGPGHWWVPPDPSLRREAVERRMVTAYGLAEPDWMARIIETTWDNLPSLAGYYDFETTSAGKTHYNGLRGPEYMQALRRKAAGAGVRIFDQCPALELLLHEDGSVAGAEGIQRLNGAPWRVRAGGVIMATGGCAFRSGLLGSHTNTGDGYLMAAEAGAELSGMEFSSMYSISPAWVSTRTAIFTFARYFDAAGRELDMPGFAGAGDFTSDMAKALMAGPVYCLLNEVPETVRQQFPQVQPATMLAFNRKGIDLYNDKFEVALFAEGTIRGTGGLRITGAQCQTTVPGLFAAGDAATRELIAGASSGGGAQNSAWALSSGLWSGAGAAGLARRNGRRASEPVRGSGGIALRPGGSAKPIDARGLTRAIQNETIPFEKALFRTGAKTGSSLAALDALWREARRHLHAQGLAATHAREAAAMLATARWCHAASLARPESRGLHRRTDEPGKRPDLARRHRIGGLDEIWTAPDTAVRREEYA
jgi:succinate dehydrogenase/fumarate reductase flavoprotein subunit